MKSLIALVTLVLSVNSFAHLENGIYRGTTSQGTTCEMKVIGVNFRNNLKHPVNEQVTVEYNSETFILAHLPSLNQNSVQVQGGFLTGFNGIKTAENKKAVTAFQVEMVHTETFEGPKEFHFVLDTKDSSTSNSVSCQELKFVE